MPIVRNFSFTLNTDTDTFCAWLEDRSSAWYILTTGANGGVVDIQEVQRAQLKSRTQFSFGAVIELTDEDASTEGWVKAEKHVFPDFRLRRGIYRANVITIMVMPAPRAGKVDIRALCNDQDALDGFSQVLTRIAESYPEAEMLIREHEEKRILASSPDSDQPYVLRGTRKRDRPRVISYNDAYQNILDGMDMKAAFDKYVADHTISKPNPDDWNNFRRAMNRRSGSRKVEHEVRHSD